MNHRHPKFKLVQRGVRIAVLCLAITQGMTDSIGLRRLASIEIRPQRLYCSTMALQKFQSLFCQRFDCSPSDYEKRALRKLLYPHARILVPVIRTLRPKFSDEDLKFVRYLGEAEDFQEAAGNVADFREVNRVSHSFLRKRCKLRVSGRKAGELVRKLFLTGSST